jgi:hypothetical protein
MSVRAYWQDCLLDLVVWYGLCGGKQSRHADFEQPGRGYCLWEEWSTYIGQLECTPVSLGWSGYAMTFCGVDSRRLCSMPTLPGARPQRMQDEPCWLSEENIVFTKRF